MVTSTTLPLQPVPLAEADVRRIVREEFERMADRLDVEFEKAIRSLGRRRAK